MLRVDCYEFYKLSVHVHPLKTLDTQPQLVDVWALLYLAKEALLEFFNTFPLRTCQTPARALYEILLKVIPDDMSGLIMKNDDDTPRLVGYAETAAVRTAATELEAVLKAELSNWDTFFVSQKGGYSTNDLINSAEKLLPELTRDYLDKASLEDVRRCGQCLAFNLGTAAAFHIIRAAEAYIVKYYEHILGVKPTIKMRNWGAYHRTLEKSGKADMSLV